MTSYEKANLEYAMKYCDEHDKSTAFMVQYMQDFAGVSFDTVMDFLRGSGKEEWREAMQELDEWSRAYPEKIFSEPTPEQVDEVCKALGCRIDNISAMVLRNFTKHYGEVARKALSTRSAEKTVPMEMLISVRQDLPVCATKDQMCRISARYGYAVTESGEPEKTVPMELVERLRYQGIHTREWIVELFAKFGYTVTESGKA